MNTSKIKSIVKRPAQFEHVDLVVSNNHNFIANGILTHNCNIPARNVVIVGTTRGLNPVDTLDIIQEGGRAGRYGIDPQGDVYLICENTKYWKDEIKNPKDVISTLMNPDMLGFHILSEIDNGEISNKDQLITWFDRTLAKLQMSIDNNILEDVIDKLVKWRMMEIVNGKYRVTALGKVSTKLYFFPQDVHHWNTHFGMIDKHNLWESDASIAFAIGSTPTLDWPYVPRNDQERVDDFTYVVNEIFKKKGISFIAKRSVIATDLHDWLAQGEVSPKLRSITQDSERITQALTWIGNLKAWDPSSLQILALRLHYGANGKIAPLCELPGVGVVRAKKLYEAGITSLDVFAEKALIAKQVLGPQLFEKAISYINQK